MVHIGNPGVDPKDVRARHAELREVIRLRQVDPKKANVDRWLELDTIRRDLMQRVEKINAERNQLQAQREGDPAGGRARGSGLRNEARALNEELRTINKEWQGILDWFPNWPHPDMPKGAGYDDNVEVKAWIPGRGYLASSEVGGNCASLSVMPQTPLHGGTARFQPAHYADLGQRLGIDTAQASKVSGSRFNYIIGDLAIMQFAVQNLLLHELIRRGFRAIVPPLLVRERALYGTSHFPASRDQIYEIKPHNVEEGAMLFLVGSSEPSNFSYFMDRTFEESQLPVKLFAVTTCFRSEAGSWGKDLKGIKRVHQFDKIELNAVCLPDQAGALYDEFLELNEWLLHALELPYRVINKCSADAGYLATHRQRDVEVWLSGVREYLELMTCTDAADYQARRLSIRYRDRTSGVGFCHTVNDTGCAMGRMLTAIIDNYQQADGSLKVPAVLRDFVKKDSIRG